MKLPQKFIDSIDACASPVFDGLIETLSTTAPETSVRVNRAKGLSVPTGAAAVDWCADGFYLDSRPSFTFDPAFHQGLYYVQDASSMAFTRIVAGLSRLIGNRPLRYLDACAAPGGKTTAAISSLPAGSVVVANEFDSKRVGVLAENLAKWGYPDVVVSRGACSRFSVIREAFDIISADAPCSGEGMMRKDPVAVSQWTPALVRECASRQREIVSDLWPALRPGGYFIYSTCTFNRAENEEVVDFICSNLGGETVDLRLDEFHGIMTGIDTFHNCYRFLPGKIRGEGLFVSVIQKEGDGRTADVRPNKKPLTAFSKSTCDTSDILRCLDGDYETVCAGDDIMALPAANARWIKSVASWLDVVAAGVRTAHIKGRDLIPEAGLALSQAFNRSVFPVVDINYSDAIAYLRGEAITLPPGIPRGYILLTFNRRSLGFVKNVGNRSNNLYPHGWRIISASAPAIYTSLI